MWNNHELAKKLYIDREKNKGTGATISIVGLKESLYDQSHEGHEILQGLKKQFEKSPCRKFWECVFFEKKTAGASETENSF